MTEEIKTPRTDHAFKGSHLEGGFIHDSFRQLEIELAQVTAELEKARQDLIPPSPTSVVIQRLKERAETAESRIKELETKLQNAIEVLRNIRNGLHCGHAPNDMLDEIDEVFSTLQEKETIIQGAK